MKVKHIYGVIPNLIIYVVLLMSPKVKHYGSVGPDSSYTISYWCLILTYGLTQPIWYTMSDSDFDLLRSVKVKSDGAVAHPIYDFL